MRVDFSTNVQVKSIGFKKQKSEEFSDGEDKGKEKVDRISDCEGCYEEKASKNETVAAGVNLTRCSDRPAHITQRPRSGGDTFIQEVFARQGK